MQAASITFNQRFGRLVALNPAIRPPDKTSRHRWRHCRCDCGELCTIREDNLLRGSTTSCGCARRKHTSVNERTSPTYQTWRAMVRRCHDPKFVAYPNYGGRGIVVCPQWRDSKTGYQTFLADVGRRPSGMTLDRKDCNGNYEPSNVRWASKQWQEWNKRGAAAAREDAAEWEWYEQREREEYGVGSGVDG